MIFNFILNQRHFVLCHCKNFVLMQISAYLSLLGRGDGGGIVISNVNCFHKSILLLKQITLLFTLFYFYITSLFYYYHHFLLFLAIYIFFKCEEKFTGANIEILASGKKSGDRKMKKINKWGRGGKEKDHKWRSSLNQNVAHSVLGWEG